MTARVGNGLAERGPADLWRALRRWWFIIALCTVSAVVLALWYSSEREPMFAATSTFLIEDRGGPAAAGADMRLRAEVSLFGSDQYEEAVAERLDVALAPPVDTVGVTDGGLVEVTVRARTPELASSAANAYVDIFQASRRQRIVGNYERVTEVLQESIVEIEDRLAGLDADDPLADALADYLSRLTDRRNTLLLALPVDLAELTVVTSATPPETPDHISDAALIIAALVAGALLGCTLAFVLQFFDRKIRTPGETVRAIGPIPLYPVPRDRRLRNGPRLHPDRRGPAVEALRDFRAAIDGHRVVLFTGVSRRSGTTTVVANVAALLYAVDRRVAVVDLAVTDPKVASVFDVSSAPLADAYAVRTVRASLSEAWRAETGDAKGEVGVLSPGPVREGIALGDVIAGLDLESLLKRLADHFDVVLVDSTAVGVSASSLPAAAVADAVVLVVGASEVERDVRRAWARLQEARANVVAALPCGIGKSAMR